MKIKDLRKQKPEELIKKLADLKSELIQLQGQAATGTPPKSPGQINKVKKTIARILTIQNEAEIQKIISKKVNKENAPSTEKKQSEAVKN